MAPRWTAAGPRPPPVEAGEVGKWLSPSPATRGIGERSATWDAGSGTPRVEAAARVPRPSKTDGGEPAQKEHP